MRFLMSLIRIVFGVSLGVGYFASMAYLPRPFSSILFCLFIWMFAGAFFYKSFRALRTGRIGINTRIKFVVYERASLEYWFYTLLSTLAGFGAVWMSLSALFPSTFHL
jgi:hypothetical protein